MQGYVDETGYDSHEEGSFSGRGEPKGPPQACLFIASLSNTTTEDLIREFFEPFGKILKIKLLKDRSARPYAFVQFATLEDSNVALENTNGQTLAGRKLRVERAKVNRTLFIAKIGQLSSAQLREIVQEYGPVESVAIIKNHQTNKSKGCGFVKYIYREDAMEAFNGLKAAQKKWVVEWATSSNDPDQLGIDKFNIFVGGLHPQQVTKELVEERFRVYGPVESITFVNRSSAADNPEGSRSSFAFVRFADPLASSQAIEQENGTEWFGRRIRVQYCESQEMKAKRRENKYMNSMEQYYANLQVPSSVYMTYAQNRGLPPVYNMPMDASMYGYPYSVMPYGNGSYVYGNTSTSPPMYAPYPYPLPGLQEQPSPDSFIKQPDDVLVSSPAENFTATEAVDSNHITHER